MNNGMRKMAACLMFFALPAGQAQNAGRLEFEVATIRPHVPGNLSLGNFNEISGIGETPGLIRIDNLSLKTMIEVAYGVKDFQFRGPAWLSDARFDIVARPPPQYKHEQLEPLLRNLLADRFKLLVHHGSSTVQGFALTVAKGGRKFPDAGGSRGYFTARPGLVSGTRVSMAELAGALANLLQRPVADETGLRAVYDIQMTWMPDDAPPAPDGGERVPDATFFTALQDQLGLRMRSRKIAVAVVIVDRVEKTPSEN